MSLRDRFGVGGGSAVTASADADSSATESVAAADGHRPRWLLALLRIRDLPVLLVLGAIIGIVTAFHPNYVSMSSLINTGRFAAYIGCMAIGMVFLLSMREIDLSVGAIYGLSAIVAARLMEEGVSPALATLAALATGCVCGAINGALANALRIQTIIVTLGTLSMYQALSLIFSGDQVLVNVPLDSWFFRLLGGDFLDVPASIWTLLALAVIGQILYWHTRFGSHVKLIGSNPESARVLGIRIERTRVAALVFQGLLCSIIGVVTLGYLQAADPTTGIGYELSVIAAAIVGGTALSGGEGSVLGAVIGAMIISAISTGLVQFGVTADWTGFATGAIIIAAVTLDSFLRRRRMAIRG
jgi:ribose transport system permease protein